MKPIKDSQDAIDRLQYLKRLIQIKLIQEEINPYLSDITAIQKWIDPSFDSNKWEDTHRGTINQED